MNTKPHLKFNTILARVKRFAKQTGWQENRRGRPGKASIVVYVALTIYCGNSGVKHNTKASYRWLVGQDIGIELPVYKNFLIQIKQAKEMMLAYLKYLSSKAASRQIIIDSAPLQIMKYVRAKVRKKLPLNEAGFGFKPHIGHYYGFKLHLSVNHRQEIISFDITAPEVYDGHLALDLITPMTKFVTADNHYGSAGLREEYKRRGCQVIAPRRKNQKDQRQVRNFKQRYKKRMLVETAFSVLKESFSLETFRPRSYLGHFSHYLRALLSYQYNKIYG